MRPPSTHDEASFWFLVRRCEILKMRKRIDEIYAKHTGKPEEEVHRDMERDRFFRADQAQEYGLIDRVIASH